MNVWVFQWAPSFSRVARQIYFVISPIFGPGPEQDPTECGIFETSDLVLSFQFQMFLKFPLTYLVQYIQCFLKRRAHFLKKFVFFLLLYPKYRVIAEIRNSGSGMISKGHLWIRNDFKGRLGSRPGMLWNLGSGSVTATFCIPDPIRNRICIRILHKMWNKAAFKIERWDL